MSSGVNASLNGFVPFSAASAWNTDISASAVDSNSANYIANIGASVGVHADFGSGLYDGQLIGIPYQITPGKGRVVPVDRVAYPTESDPGPLPLPNFTVIQGFPNPQGGDRHVLLLDSGNCWLYEMYNASFNGTLWSADEVAIWDMEIAEQRPYSWTSADAAGLPVFAGLVRYDEVLSGAIRHALSFTVASSQEAFTPPASHLVYGNTDKNALPMGTRLRLKGDFDISTYSAANQVILTALKKYGMFVCDNGASMFLNGAPDQRWDDDDLAALGGVTARNFEVVQMGPIYTPANYPTGPAPAISSFTASASNVSAGSPVTLQWSASDMGYAIVTPRIGPVRGSSVVVYPKRDTTYTLTATNQFGRSTASVTVTVE